jgi:hypothetical protein
VQARRREGLTLRQAAITAGLFYLFDPAGYAEFTLYPKIVIASNAAQTFHNIAANPQLFAILIGCWFVAFLEDIVIAWALYYLLRRVSKAGSLLAAFFRVLYAAVVLSGLSGLLVAYRLVTVPQYTSEFGARALVAQVDLAIHAFRYEYSFALIIFGMHLVLVGYLIVRSTYIPKILGPILAIDGLGWITNGLQPYFFPTAHLDWIFYTFFGELVFMLWLLIGGWFVKEPAAAALAKEGSSV